MSVAVALQGDDGADGADGAQGPTGAKGAQGSAGAKGSQGAAGQKGSQGADNQDFDFLASGLSSVPTPPAGLVMNADVFGYHNTLGSVCIDI